MLLVRKTIPLQRTEEQHDDEMVILYSGTTSMLPVKKAVVKSQIKKKLEQMFPSLYYLFTLFGLVSGISFKNMPESFSFSAVR